LSQGIAVIARNRRDRKGRTLPLINADDADLNETKPYRWFHG